MNQAESTIQTINTRQDSILHKCLEAGAVVRDSFYGCEVYEFSDGSILTSLDGLVTAYDSIRDISQ